MHCKIDLKDKTDFAHLSSSGRTDSKSLISFCFSLHFTRTVRSATPLLSHRAVKWQAGMHQNLMLQKDLQAWSGNIQACIAISTSINPAMHMYISRCEKTCSFTVSVTWFLDLAALWRAVMPSLALKSRWAPPFFSVLIISTTLSRWAANVSGLSKKGHRSRR